MQISRELDYPSIHRANSELFLRRLRRRNSFLEKYEHNRVLFVHDLIRWDLIGKRNVALYQSEILMMFDNYERVAVVGPHGLGKTTLASWLVLHFAIIYSLKSGNWKIITVAGVHRQLKEFLWPEIHKWRRLLNWAKIPLSPFEYGKNALDLKLYTENGAAIAASPKEPGLIEGAHANNILYLFDEAKLIKEPIFTAAEGAFTNPSDFGTVKAGALSTPGDPVGTFFDIIDAAEGYDNWKTRHVKIEECIRAGRVSSAWVEDKKRQWGEKSVRFIQKVKGLFVKNATDGIIPSEWLELAFKRYDDFIKEGGSPKLNNVDAGGFDVSDGGDDLTTYCLIDEDWLFSEIVIVKLQGEKDDALMQHSSTSFKLCLKYPNLQLALDSIGVGAGVKQRACELLDLERASRQKYQRRMKTIAPMGNVIGFKAGNKTDIRDLAQEQFFLNQRACAWWLTREVLCPDNGYNVKIKRSKTLKEELLSPGFTERSGAIIQVESKKELKKPDRLGRSTDEADALVQAVYAKFYKEKEFFSMVY